MFEMWPYCLYCSVSATLQVKVARHMRGLSPTQGWGKSNELKGQMKFQSVQSSTRH